MAKRSARRQTFAAKQRRTHMPQRPPNRGLRQLQLAVFVDQLPDSRQGPNIRSVSGSQRARRHQAQTAGHQGERFASKSREIRSSPAPSAERQTLGSARQTVVAVVQRPPPAARTQSRFPSALAPSALQSAVTHPSAERPRPHECRCPATALHAVADARDVSVVARYPSLPRI